MKDLSVSTGAKYFQTMLGDDVSSVTLNDLGTCKTIEISKYGTIVVGGDGDVEGIQNRIDDLEQQIKDIDSIFKMLFFKH